jgi:hypothetical protein
MKAFRAISAFVLAFLVLVSSTSFMVGMHICMGEVQNVALFEHADDCQKMKLLPACHKHLKPSCCQEEVLYHDGTDFKASIEQTQIEGPAPAIIEVPFLMISEIIPASEISRIQYFDYDPPLPSSDLTVTLQVFLI